MDYDSLKVLPGQETVTIARIKPDKCKHTTAQSVIDGDVFAPAGISNSFTGNFTISGGNSLSFSSSNPYVLWDNEIIKVTVLSAVQLDITERGALGTSVFLHGSGNIKIMHSGEADGSCLSFPDGCSSADSYDEDVKHIFDFPSTQLQQNIIFYNGFSKWSHKPAIVDPGQTIGKRAGGSVSLKDSKDTDVYVPYPDRRSLQGTLFNKWIARNPNFSGRPIEIMTGLDPLSYDEDNFIIRQYIIDKYSLNDGIMNFTFKDPLILTEDKKAKAPRASLGVLSVAVTNISTTITYTGAPAFDYGASGAVFVRIGSEEIECTVLADFVLTIVTRGFGGTVEADHSVNATVQSVLVYDEVNVVEVIIDQMENYTEINDVFLDDYTSIIAETSSITVSAHITKPEPVINHINDLIKNGDLNMFYSETEHLIKIQAVSDETAGVININEDDHIERGSIKVDTNIKNQFTRYTVAWALNDSTKTKDDEYFDIIFQSVNLTQELPEKKGEINENNTFFNKWLTDSNDDVIIGTSIAQKLIDRSDKTPEIFTFNLDMESVFNTQNSRLDLGTIFNLSTSRRVNSDGSNKAANYQVLSMKDLTNNKYMITARLFQDPIAGINVDFTISDDKSKYDLSTEFSPAAGNYVILIDTGVEITSDSVATSAFTTGTQAAGVTFDFIIRGSILSQGGNGGDAGTVIALDPQDVPGITSELGDIGRDGGIAFEATVDCNINVGSGAIWAGGGGGAGGKSEAQTFVLPELIKRINGNGGCGAQGFAIAFGGIRGSVLVENHGTTFGLTGVSGSQGSEGIQGSNSGGKWGEDGTNESGILGGKSGFAIVSNGNTVNITNGDNAINIKGRRS